MSHEPRVRVSVIIILVLCTVVQNAFIFIQLLKHVIHSTEIILVKVYAILNAKEIRVLSVQERDFYTSDCMNI